MKCSSLMMIQVLSGRHQPPDPDIMGSFSANKQLIHIGALFPRTEQTANVEEGFRDGGGGLAQSSLTTPVFQCEERRKKQNKPKKTRIIKNNNNMLAKCKPPLALRGLIKGRRAERRRERQENRRAGRSGEPGCRSRASASAARISVSFLAPLLFYYSLPSHACGYTDILHN